MTRRLAALGAIALAILALAAPTAFAIPTADSPEAYQALGAVFPDPLAGCQQAGTSPCTPNAEGRIPATQFIGYSEFLKALTFMNTQDQWKRYMEVWPLDGKLGDGAGNAKAPDVPGNNLDPEFKPDRKFVSAGLPTSTGDREKHDLIVVRVTDETVPDKNKKRYALSLSIHGIERAGVEGGTRAMEDLVTAYTTGLATKTVVPKSVDPAAPTFGEALKKTIVYFTYPNPDGWSRGEVSAGRVFFQRYNGNGVDPNRDWPDIGFSFRPYSGLSEPESRALSSFLDQVKTGSGEFAAGDDLHGQPEADALSYTLLPHGSHGFDKDIRIRETAKTIHRNSEQALKWSPIIQADDKPRGGGLPCSPDVLGTACAQIYAQTWGSVYDTINYTTTGALGDYFDSSVGLGADGIDNEMSFSHLDKNIVFDPHTEQLHVDGNKALIYAHLAELTHPATGRFDAPGVKGYVPNKRVKGSARDLPAVPPGTKPHDDIDVPATAAEPDPGSGTVVLPIGNVGGAGIYNGGMRVDVTATNAQGIGAGVTTLAVQCQNCETHRSLDPDAKPGDWITVAEDYNQSPLYAQAGVTVAVNDPDSDKDVNWRAVVSATGGAPKAHVEFTSGPATTDGNTGGDTPPRQRAYDVANTDFFRDLNRHLVDDRQDFETVDPAKVIDGRQSLDDLTSLVLADDPLPGYTGDYGGKTLPTGAPTKNVAFSGSATPPAAVLGPGVVPGSTYEQEFTIGPNDANRSATIRVDWADATNDFDMFVDRVEADGSRNQVATSANGSTNFEETSLDGPAAGKYVVRVLNFAAADPAFTGKVTFAPLAAPPGSGGTGSFTLAEKNRWAAKLKAYVEDGGNLVLTDGALRILPEISGIDENAVNRQTVYAGQIAFGTSASESTVKDRLARNIDQTGARFNTGNRRQMYEPTPLGFAIQDAAGGDESNAVQYDVDRAAWEKLGGRTAGTSADSGTRNAAAVYTRTTLGELKKGKGQIRIAGALLPQPTEKVDHPFGLEPYSATYTGYIVVRNLLDTTAKGLPGVPGDRTNPAPGDKGSASGAQGAGGKNTGRNLVISRRAVKLKNRVAAVRVSCRSIHGCKGTLKLTLRQKTRTKSGTKRSRTITLGTATFDFEARSRNAIVRVTLSRNTARVASTMRRQRVTALASVRFGDRTSGRTGKQFWLYRPKKR